MSNKNIVNKERNMFVDDDSVTYNIRNKQGKLLGKFEFHPSDTNIVERFGEVVDYFNNLTLPDNNDEAIKAAEKELVDKVSYLIGADAKETFFNILGPFSILSSGELFVENVLGAVAKVIEKEMSVRTKKLQRRTNKYVRKYHK